MAKRELSSTLRNLKFMQRAAQKEEKPKKEDEVKPDGNFFNSAQVRKKWYGFYFYIEVKPMSVVIMEGDPHPGAFKGRMSFQSFNPSIDVSIMILCMYNYMHCDRMSSIFPLHSRENGSSQDGSQSLAVESNDIDGDLKRKQPEVVSEAQYPNKSQKNIQGDRQSPPINSRGSHKQQKREKQDWNVLRPPPKYQNQRD
ncbi:hypothetical protein RJ641_008712 [Dillenia turbinata]|uniref:Uncharacterized protein n=1 Tax=Dillenia turbinata TaxID=194707 RepID=A0AAN8V1X6_9MAGN